jgi:hypothetical protein
MEIIGVALGSYYCIQCISYLEDTNCTVICTYQTVYLQVLKFSVVLLKTKLGDCLGQLAVSYIQGSSHDPKLFHRQSARVPKNTHFKVSIIQNCECLWVMEKEEKHTIENKHLKLQ